jgi:hypothetical protein
MCFFYNVTTFGGIIEAFSFSQAVSLAAYQRVRFTSVTSTRMYHPVELLTSDAIIFKSQGRSQSWKDKNKKHSCCVQRCHFVTRVFYIRMCVMLELHAFRIFSRNGGKGFDRNSRRRLHRSKVKQEQVGHASSGNNCLQKYHQHAPRHAAYICRFTSAMTHHNKNQFRSMKVILKQK